MTNLLDLRKHQQNTYSGKTELFLMLWNYLFRRLFSMYYSRNLPNNFYKSFLLQIKQIFSPKRFYIPRGIHASPPFGYLRFFNSINLFFSFICLLIILFIHLLNISQQSCPISSIKKDANSRKTWCWKITFSKVNWYLHFLGK